MTILLLLIPAALFLGAIGLAAFLWSLCNGQFDDLDGTANRFLVDEDQPKRTNRQEAGFVVVNVAMNVIMEGP